MSFDKFEEVGRGGDAGSFRDGVEPVLSGDSNLDDFNPLLDDDDDVLDGFEELQEDHAKEVSAVREGESERRERESLSFEGFREKLPERVGLPESVKRNGEVSENFKKERTESRRVKSGSGGGSGSRGKRVLSVDEDLEKSKPVVEVVESRSRESGVGGGESGGLRPGEKWNGVEVKTRYRYARDNGLLNGAELEFFRDNDVARRAVLAGDSSLDYLRPSARELESDEDRKKRISDVTEAVFGRDALKRGSQKRWNRKHQEVLEFLALFKYATPRHLAKLFAEAPSTAYKRLKELRLRGLVVDKKLLGGEPLWFLTEAGMLLSGYDLPRITEARISYPMLPHQFGVNHVAANLWGAGINVLHEDDYPKKNRVDLKGQRVFGDRLVSELAIQSSFGKLKLFSKADVYLPTLKASIERAYRKWEEAGGVEFGDSPEFQLGNEYMWAIFPPAAVKLAYHVPDLVVARSRSEDGSANSVAIELEIQNKSVDSYRRALTAYRYSEKTYGRVVWVCHRAATANKLREVGREMGMLDSGFLKIVPVITSDGVFKGKDLWTL